LQWTHGRFLVKHNIAHCFPVLIAGDDGHGRKPAPDPFYAALDKLSVAPERAFFIGDRIDDDCGGANAAGLTPFLIDRDRQHADETADADFICLHSLTDLLPHLPIGTTNGYT
jgi:FMN phosphatase YigB (HAD superfamily)